MKVPTTVLMFFLLSFLLVACSQTKVIVLNQTTQVQAPSQESNASTQAATNSTNAAQPAGTGAAVDLGGKVPVKCEATDPARDPSVTGAVTITYSDGSSDVFYDDCPGSSNIETKYYCNGNTVQSENNICPASCVLVPVNADPTKKVGFCFNMQ